MSLVEKRKHPRFKSLNLLSYVCFDDKNHALEQGMGRTLNVSESGILLETHVPIDPQYIVALSIGLKDDTMDAMGKIVYSHTSEYKKYASGIKFIETDEKALQTLKMFLKVSRE